MEQTLSEQWRAFRRGDTGWKDGSEENGDEMAKTTDQEGLMEEVSAMVETMAKMIVDEPDQIEVKTAPGDGFLAMEVTCSESDVGMLLGRQGRNAEAMRTLFSAACAARQMRGTLHVVGGERSRIAR